jgi:hypothetical protein
MVVVSHPAHRENLKLMPNKIPVHPDNDADVNLVKGLGIGCILGFILNLTLMLITLALMAFYHLHVMYAFALTMIIAGATILIYARFISLFQKKVEKVETS